MADQSDVENAMVALAAATLYPLGTANGSVTGAVFRLYRGWPANAALEADLANGIQHVSVCAVAGSHVPVEQFPLAWEIPAPVTPSLTIVTGLDTVTFGGTASLGQLAGILADDDGFAYRTQTGDTPESVAANLAVLINQQLAATVSGASVSVPGVTRLIGRVEADQTALLPTRRQRCDFRLTCWCADPISRDATASALDAAFAQAPWLTLADGSAGRMIYAASQPSDDLSPLPLFRRELTYSVEYTTTLVQVQPSMLIGIFANEDVAGSPILHLS